MSATLVQEGCRWQRHPFPFLFPFPFSQGAFQEEIHDIEDMLNQYMVEFQLPKVIDETFLGLIPEQRARVNELVHEGTIRSYTLTLDRAKLWVVFVAGSEGEVKKLIRTFPISPYVEAEIHELMFHDMASHELPRLSLN
ncbi:MAG: muconolactone Delta-isomerase family protein [Bacteroidota bacterium]